MSDTAAPIVDSETATFTPVERCWICGGADLTRANDERLDLRDLIADPRLADDLRPYEGGRFHLCHCGDCGFMQPDVLPASPRYFDAIYNCDWSHEWLENEFASGYKDSIFDAVLAALARRLSGPGRALLDVGAHVGRMLELARRRGWRPEGIELNPKTAAFAAASTGLVVHRKNAKELTDEGRRFDAVTLTDVLEHIPDPVPVLSQLRELLEPGGWIAVKVPCGAAQRLKQRVRSSLSKKHDRGIATNLVHVNHFGARSLALALSKAGFDKITVGVAAPELPTERTFKAALDRSMRRGVYTLARLLPFGMRTPLALNLQAYARNPLA